MQDYPDSLFSLAVKQMSIYQKALPLRPGLYRLDLVIKDVSSGNVGAVNTRLAVPRYDDDKLEASTLDYCGPDRTRARQADWHRAVCIGFIQGPAEVGRQFHDRRTKWEFTCRSTI